MNVFQGIPSFGEVLHYAIQGRIRRSVRPVVKLQILKMYFGPFT